MSEKIKIDGKEYDIEEIKRWKDTRENLEREYNRKFQELAEKEKEVEELMTWREYFREHPDIALKVSQLIETGGIENDKEPRSKTEDSSTKEHKEETAKAEDKVEPYEDIKKKITEIEQYISEQKKKEIVAYYEQLVEQEKQRIEQEIEELRKEFPLMRPEVVLAHLIADENANLRELAEEDHKAMQRLLDERTEEYLKRKKEEKKTASPVSGGGVANVSTAKPAAKLGTQDLIERVKEIFK